jgi:hypothetical protein
MTTKSTTNRMRCGRGSDAQGLRRALSVRYASEDVMSTLALIPARAGSVRLPGKNNRMYTGVRKIDVPVH